MAPSSGISGPTFGGSGWNNAAGRGKQRPAPLGNWCHQLIIQKTFTHSRAYGSPKPSESTSSQLLHPPQKNQKTTHSSVLLPLFSLSLLSSFDPPGLAPIWASSARLAKVIHSTPRDPLQTWRNPHRTRRAGDPHRSMCRSIFGLIQKMIPARDPKQSRGCRGM